MDSWTSRNGLSSNSINTINQTDGGYLWLATFNGLLRFDGLEFTSFHSSNTPGLVTNRTSRVFKDSGGRLWVGTEADQVTVIEQDSSYHLGLEQGLGNSQINAITEDDEGTIWVGSFDGLFWWDEENHTFQRFTNHGDGTGDSVSQLYSESAVYRQYPEQAVFHLYKDHDEMIWVVSPTRIWPLTKACRENVSPSDEALCRDAAWLAPDGAVSIRPFLSNEDSLYKANFSAKEEPADKPKVAQLIDLSNGPEDVPYFFSIAQSSDDTWWFGTLNGLIRYAGGEVKRFTENHLSHGTVTNIYVDSNKRVWIGTQQGLQVIEQGEGEPGEPLPEFANSSITHIVEDHEQSIWVGTASSGLKRIKSTPFQVIGEPEGLTSNAILSVHEDAQDNLWVGTNCFGFNKIEPSGNQNAPSSEALQISEHSINSKITHLTREVKDGTVTRFWQETGWRNGCVWTMATTSDGTLWIGEWGGGLSMMRPGEEIRPAPFNNQLESEVISALYQDQEGGLWIGTRGAGAYRWYQSELTYYNISDGMSHSTITYIFQDRGGAMWFSTHNGVTRYFQGSFLQILREDGLSHDHVRMLMEPSPGIIWAGTYGGGLNQIKLLSEDSVDVGVLDTQTGLNDDIVSQIFEDDYGRIWLGGNKGISHLPKQKLVDYFSGDRKRVDVTTYGFEEGMRSNETNGGFQPSGWKTRNGNLLFPTVNGLVVADPSKVVKNVSPPQVAIEHLLTGDTVLAADSSIYLEAGSNDFEIKYTALSFLNPDKVEFEYRLEGFDSAWRPAGNRRTAFFTNIPPGEYSFQVRASNNDGVWNQEGASIAVIVAPFFFQTVWFYGLCLLGFAGLIVLGYQWRVSHLKQRERVLENTVKQQTEALETQNRKLKEMDQVKSRFFANVSHEFRTPLTLILGPLNELLREKKYQNIEHDLSLMRRNGIRLKRLIDQILDLVKLESKSLKLDLQKFKLDQLVVEIVDLFRPLTAKQELTLVIKENTDIPEGRQNGDFTIVADKDKVERILANLLSNAIKFTDKGGRIEVQLKTTEKRTTISVTDTGRGISKDDQRNIFDRFYQVEEGDNRPAEGMGIGLALCKELMLLHHGDISVESEPGEGSTFTLEFLKGTEHFGESAKNLMLVAHDKTADDSGLNLNPAEYQKSKEQVSEADPVILNRDQTTLLIVEDHLDMREYVKSILAEEYKVLESSHGEEALEIIEKTPPDLIIADIMMPVMDGLTFSRQLRKSPLHKNIPILFLTAQAGDENEIKALKEGGDSYLQKPFSSDLLKTRITSLLSLQQRLREQLLSDALVSKDNGNLKKSDNRRQNESEHFQPENWTSELIRQMQPKLSDPNFGVDQLAELMLVSRSQLHRKTKKNTGRSPIQLLRETRLKKAREMIEDGQTNYSEIAYACGFNSLSYFSRSYKKQFGFAPSDTSSV